MNSAKIKLSTKIFFVVIAAMLVLFCFSFSSIGVANAEGTKGASLLEKCQEVTEDRYLIVNNETKNISQYESYLDNRFQLDNKKFSTTNLEDEWILKIVPIEVFKAKKEFFYVGNAYGFYVNYDNDTQTYLVYLLLNQYEYYNGSLSREIRPLYYEQYVFNEQTGTLSLVYVKSGKRCYYRKYSDYEKLYLKDVSFSGSLYNENHLNVDESGYIPNQDNGGYFTQSQYVFKGMSTQSEKMNFADAALQIGLGYIPLGTSGLSVGNVLNAASTITELKNNINNATEEFSGKVSNEKVYEFTKFSKMTRDKQIEMFGKPLKNSATKFQTKNTKEAVLLGINSDNYARNEYLINYYDQSNMWNTRYVGQVSLDIVKEVSSMDGSKVKEIANDIEAEASCVYTIDNGETTKLNEEATKDIYILKDAKHKISFKAPLNGRYTIGTLGNVANDIDVNQGEIISKETIDCNKKITFYLKRDDTIELSVVKNNINSSNILSVKVEFIPEIINKNEDKTIAINPNETEYFVYEAKEAEALDYILHSANPMSFNLSYQFSNNSKFFVEGENIFGSFIAKSGKYFIGMQNKGSTPVEATLTLCNSESVNVGEQKTTQLVYHKAINLIAPFATRIEINVTTDNPIIIELYKNDVLIALSENSIVKTLRADVESGEHYYILLKNLSYQSVEVNLKVEWNATKLSLGNNTFNHVETNHLFVFKTPTFNANFEIDSNTDYCLYNSKLETIAANIGGDYSLNANSSYYLATTSEIESLRLEIRLKTTSNLSGTFPESGRVFIKYIPSKTATYKITGSNTYYWYNAILQPTSAYLDATYTYYLEIDGIPSQQYDISIIMNRNQVPIGRVANLLSGNYYFNIENAGVYSFRTYCSNNVTSTISIFNENGEVVVNNGISCENLNTDTNACEINLGKGTYYIDLNVRSHTDQVGLQISKTQ